jgi:UDP-glucose 4-epimerase
MIIDITGSKSEVVNVPYEQAFGPGFEDTTRRLPDMARAREFLEWEPQVKLRDGLPRTLAWCREHYGLMRRRGH